MCWLRLVGDVGGVKTPVGGVGGITLDELLRGVGGGVRGIFYVSFYLIIGR